MHCVRAVSDVKRALDGIAAGMSFKDFAVLTQKRSEMIPIARAFENFSQKRRVYYKTNVIVNPLVASFELYIGIHMLVQLISTQSLVLSQSLGYKLINAYQTHINDKTGTATKIIEYFKVTDGNVIFGIGYFIASAVILFAIANIALTIFKFSYQKSQPQVDLNQVHINE